MQFVDFVPWDQLKLFGLRLGFAAIVLLGFWIAAAIAGKLIEHFSVRLGPERMELLNLGAQVARIGVRIFGGVTALGTLGVDVSALVAGLGLTGFALGFALKDALSNLLAGAMILFYRPFRRGSRISVGGFEGTVTQIDLRYTRLRGKEQDYLLPNSTLLTNAITLHRPSPAGEESDLSQRS